MQRHEEQGLLWYTFEEDQGTGHALVTRKGGVSRGPFATLNLGHTVGDDPAAVEENHRRLFAVLGLDAAQIVSPHQVHGARVVRATHDDGGTIIPACDALITDEPHLTLMMRFADCLPVLFHDPVHHAVGLAHAGWRGTTAGVIRATVQAMVEAFGSHPAELWAGIGPGIGGTTYVVGPEVVKAVLATLSHHRGVAWQEEGQWHLDLAQAVRWQLAELGVRQVESSGLDTAARTDEWFSYRAEKGKTGRFGVLLWLP